MLLYMDAQIRATQSCGTGRDDRSEKDSCLTIFYEVGTISVSTKEVAVPSLLIKNIPEKLRSQLQKTAKQHQRSMNQQAIICLADALDAGKPLPRPAAIKVPFDNAFIKRAKRIGRS